ncbi:MAG: hypothetical protein WCR69_04480 [Sulfuricurvum sp.]
MSWDWQSALASRYSAQDIFKDMASEDSLLFDLAKEDVAKILQKTNFRFVVQQMSFDDIYPFAVSTTRGQLQKAIHSGKMWLNCTATCQASVLKLIKKIVVRITNNIKNLFDDRYKICIKKDLILFANSLEQNYTDETDPLEILLNEELEREMMRKTKSEHELHIEYLATHLRLEANEQLALCFNDPKEGSK